VAVPAVVLARRGAAALRVSVRFTLGSGNSGPPPTSPVPPGTGDVFPRRARRRFARGSGPVTFPSVTSITAAAGCCLTRTGREICVRSPASRSARARAGFARMTGVSAASSVAAETGNDGPPAGRRMPPWSVRRSATSRCGMPSSRRIRPAARRSGGSVEHEDCPASPSVRRRSGSWSTPAAEPPAARRGSSNRYTTECSRLGGRR
jgi:hypothetical protein